jgi:hypothetical protein
MVKTGEKRCTVLNYNKSQKDAIHTIFLHHEENIIKRFLQIAYAHAAHSAPSLTTTQVHTPHTSLGEWLAKGLLI